MPVSFFGVEWKKRIMRRKALIPETLPIQRGAASKHKAAIADSLEDTAIPRLGAIMKVRLKMVCGPHSEYYVSEATFKLMESHVGCGLVKPYNILPVGRE